MHTGGSTSLKGLRMKAGNVNCLAVLKRRIRVLVEGEECEEQGEINI